MPTFTREQVMSGVQSTESQLVRDPQQDGPPQPKTPPPPGVPADMYQGGPLNSHPPGLLHAHPPKPAPTRVVHDGNTSLFRDFAEYLDHGIDDDGNPVILDLTCVICKDNKLLASCATTNRNSGETTEWLAVLPCGHYFGSECLSEYMESSESPRCPLCRFDLVYSCGHRIPAHEYNPVLRRRDQMAMTLPEGGAIPTACDVCYERQIECAIESLRGLLYPCHVATEDFRTPGAMDTILDSFAWLRREIERFMVLRDQYNTW